jgi:small conductance mechanosensitive channel
MTWEEFGNRLLGFLTDFGGKLIIALLVLVVGFWLVRLLIRVLGKSKLMKKDPTVAKFLSGTIKISLNTLVVVTVIGILGVPMSSVIAVIASAGVAIGLALQGALSNFAGGIMILIFHPFRIGDFVDAGGYSGTVKEIGIFYTVMTTPDNREVTIPNGTITGSSVVNYSVNDTRRVDLTVSVAYGSDINRVQHVLLEEAAKQTLALTDPAPFVRLTKQNDSSLDFTVRVWTKKEDYWTVHFDLLEAIQKRLEAEKIEIPFPQLDVHVKNDANA